MIRACAAVVLREWRVQRRYPISMVNLALLTPLYQLALPTLLLGSAFLVGGSALGLSSEVGTTDMAGWIGLGVLSASLMAGAATSVYDTLEADRRTGVIEHSWATPAPREAYVIGGVLTGSMFASVASLILLALATVLLGASFTVRGALLSLPVLALMVAGNGGYCYLVAAVLLLMRRAGALVEVCTMFAVLFSGISFPLLLLPGMTRWPTYLLPDTWELDLVRHLTLDSRLLAPPPVELAAAGATALLWLAVGRLAFLRADRRLAIAGSLTQF